MHHFQTKVKLRWVRYKVYQLFPSKSTVCVRWDLSVTRNRCLGTLISLFSAFFATDHPYPNFQVNSICESDQMKTTNAFPVAFFVAMLASASLWAQPPVTFMVIKVSGQVYSELLMRDLQTGDVILQSDKLRFGSKESYLHVINPGEGQKAVRNIPDTSPRELTQLFDKFLDPKKQGAKSRGGNPQYMEKLTEQLSRDRLLILGNGRIAVDTTKMRLHKPYGIKAMYEIDGKKFDKVISDQVAFTLGRNKLFDSSRWLSGPTSYPKVQLYYYEDLNDPAFSPFSLIGFFTPAYVDEAALIEEVKAIVNAFRSDLGQRSIILQEILTYLAGEYGDPLESNLREWLDSQKILN